MPRTELPKLKLDVSHLKRTALGKDVLAALSVYEEGKRVELGWKRYVAVRTRTPLIEHGPQKFISRTLARHVTTPGFKVLIATGNAKLTYEWIALSHPTKFSSRELAIAAGRLKQAGVKKLPKHA